MSGWQKRNTMDFKDNVLKLSERISKQRDAVKTEEATKTSFIMPLIAALGYDIFDPFEVIPEMDCDLTKQNDKIDYAIQKDGKTILLIECKQCSSNLNLHNTQLAKYYAASNARFGVLTNGIEYRFYADLDKNNIMDEKPFLVVDMLDLSDEVIEQLKKFHKSYFNESNILSVAQELKYSTEIKKLIKQELDSPSTDMVKLFAKRTYNFSITQKVIEQLTPIVKESFADVINDIIQERLSLASKIEKTEESDVDNQELTNDGVITTDEEIEAYNIIRGIIGKEIPASKVEYKDYKSYFVISVYKHYYWICRLRFGSRKKTISFPLEDYKGEKSVEIKSLDDIFKYTEHFYEALKTAKKQHLRWNKE